MTFHNLVDVLHAEIIAAHFTPTEIREAAMLAQILYEERRPFIFREEDFPTVEDRQRWLRQDRPGRPNDPTT